VFGLQSLRCDAQMPKVISRPAQDHHLWHAHVSIRCRNDAAQRLETVL
jgi:hypothetical protein